MAADANYIEDLQSFLPDLLISMEECERYKSSKDEFIIDRCISDCALAMNTLAYFITKFSTFHHHWKKFSNYDIVIWPIINVIFANLQYSKRDASSEAITYRFMAKIRIKKCRI